MDFTPVTLSNPAGFAERVKALADQYAAMEPAILESIRRDGKLGEPPHDSERVHTLGTAVERLHDVMPNLIMNLMLFADEPTVGGREQLLKFRQQSAYRLPVGNLIDNAARESAMHARHHDDLLLPDQLRALESELNPLLHDVEKSRAEGEAIGPATARLGVEPRSGWVKE